MMLGQFFLLYTLISYIYCPLLLQVLTHYMGTMNCVRNIYLLCAFHKYEGWNFNSGNYLFTTDTR